MQKNLMNKNPYKSCEDYEVFIFDSKEEWKKGRDKLHGIGGSDSASACGESKWRSNYDLWLIKTGRKEAKDISSNPAVHYGTLAEEHIRNIFALDNASMLKVYYEKNCILKSKRIPCMLYSPDGLLIDNETGELGVLEIKTSSPKSRQQWQEWKGQIPQQYFIQVLHGMSVTNASFAVLRAYLRKHDNDASVVNYRIDRSEFENEIRFVEETVKEFWKLVENDEEPATKIYTKGLEIN